jgi:hypothetical protein
MAGGGGGRRRPRARAAPPPPPRPPPPPPPRGGGAEHAQISPCVCMLSLQRWGAAPPHQGMGVAATLAPHALGCVAADLGGDRGAATRVSGHIAVLCHASQPASDDDDDDDDEREPSAAQSIRPRMHASPGERGGGGAWPGVGRINRRGGGVSLTSTPWPGVYSGTQQIRGSSSGPPPARVSGGETVVKISVSGARVLLCQPAAQATACVRAAEAPPSPVLFRDTRASHPPSRIV